MMIHSGLDNMTKQRMQQAHALSKEARGDPTRDQMQSRATEPDIKASESAAMDSLRVARPNPRSSSNIPATFPFVSASPPPPNSAKCLNLGKKISVPKDVMMEELNLTSNRGSRMFQERQKRVEKFTLENAANSAHSTAHVYPAAAPPLQIIQEPQGEKENQAFSLPGKHSLVVNLQKTLAKKGSPDVLAPGYSGPLKVIPHEKFNTTVIPKSYCSPWREALGTSDEFATELMAQLPQPPQVHKPANFRCFNRTPVPFGGAQVSKRVIPIIGYEAVESQNLPGIALERMCRRPNFNRAPRGWRVDYCPESNEL